jgi:hypothetical protein
MFLHVLRAFFVLAVVSVAWSYIAADPEPGSMLEVLQYNKPWVLMGVIVLALVIVAVDVLIGQKSLMAISGLFFGIVVGMVMAFGISVIMDLVVQSYAPDLRKPVYATVPTEKLVPKSGPNGTVLYSKEIVSENQLIGYRDQPFISTLEDHHRCGVLLSRRQFHHSDQGRRALRHSVCRVRQADQGQSARCCSTRPW